jgi:DNA-binding MarR family transcriptional regulator
MERQMNPKAADRGGRKRTSTAGERQRAAPLASSSTPRRHAAIQAALEGFRRTSGVLHKLTRTASGEEFGLADAYLLHFIGAEGSRTPGDIASFTGLTSGSVTSLIDRLERGGYVARERSTADRRVVMIGLTPKARESLGAVMAHAHERVEHMFAAWTTEEIAAFAAFLARFGEDGGEP